MKISIEAVILAALVAVGAQAKMVVIGSPGEGDLSAIYNLGVSYALGKGVPQDDKEAVKWFRLGAEQGDSRSQSLLGIFYREGRGVPQDDKEAVKWYIKAAEQGGADAQNSLAWLLASCPEDGLRNGSLAVTYARKACEQTGWKDAGYIDTLFPADLARRPGQPWGEADRPAWGPDGNRRTRRTELQLTMPSSKASINTFWMVASSDWANGGAATPTLPRKVRRKLHRRAVHLPTCGFQMQTVFCCIGYVMDRSTTGL